MTVIKAKGLLRLVGLGKVIFTKPAVKCHYGIKESRNRPLHEIAPKEGAKSSLPRLNIKRGAEDARFKLGAWWVELSSIKMTKCQLSRWKQGGKPTHWTVCNEVHWFPRYAQPLLVN